MSSSDSLFDAHSPFWFGLIPFKQNIANPDETAFCAHWNTSGQNTGLGQWILDQEASHDWYLPKSVLTPGCCFGFRLLFFVTLPVFPDFPGVGTVFLQAIALYLNLLGLLIWFFVFVYIFAIRPVLTAVKNFSRSPSQPLFSVRSRLFIVATLINLFLSAGFAAKIGQRRPYGSCVTTPGMPSGHCCMNYMLFVFYMAWSYCNLNSLERTESDTRNYSGSGFEGWLLRHPVLVGLSLVTVPFARVYVNDHAPIEVLYGTILGIIVSCSVLGGCWSRFRANGVPVGTLSGLRETLLPLGGIVPAK